MTVALQRDTGVVNGREFHCYVNRFDQNIVASTAKSACFVNAMANTFGVAAGLGWVEVWLLCKQWGWVNEQGLSGDGLRDLVEAKPWLVPVDPQPNGKISTYELLLEPTKSMMLLEYNGGTYDEGRYIEHGHVSAIVDGILFDWSTYLSKPVDGLYIVDLEMNRRIPLPETTPYPV